MSELSLRDLGMEPDVPDVEMPLVEDPELNKAKEVLRWANPEKYKHDPVLHRHTCELLSSNGSDTYAVTISFNAKQNAWNIWRCTCPIAGRFDAPCKHVLAFFIYLVEQIRPNSILSPEAAPLLPRSTSRKSSAGGSRKSTVTRATSRPSANAATTVAVTKKAPAAAPSSSAIINAAPPLANSFSSAVSHDQTTTSHQNHHSHAPSAARAMSPALPLHQVVPAPTHAAPSSSTTHHHAPAPHSNQPGLNRAASPLIPPPSVPGSVAGGHPPAHAAARKEVWKCALCGTKNTGSGTRCRECQAIRKPDSDSMPSSLSSFAASSAQRAADVQSLSWKCNICSYVNNVGLKTCKICKAARPVSGSAPSITSNNTTQSSLALSTNAPPAVNPLGSNPPTTNPPTATPVPAAIPSTASVPTPQQPLDSAMSLSFEAFPPFTPDDTAAAPSDAAPKKAMSVIAEALNSQLDEPGPSVAITGAEAEKRKRWERILNEGFSTSTRAKAAAAASSSSEAAASSSASKATASTAPKAPVVLQFTKGRGGRPAPAQPVLLLSKDELVKKRKAREEQESILAIMEETAAAELKAREKQEKAESKKKAAFTGRVPKSRQAKTESGEKKPKKRKRIGESDKEEESEYEGESTGEVEEVKEDEAESKSRATGSRGVKPDVENAAAPESAAAAAASSSAATESVAASKPGRVVPQFLADIIGGKKKAAARTRKIKNSDEMGVDETDAAASTDVKPKRKPVAKRATSSKRSTTKKAARSTRKTRTRDDDSRENSESSGVEGDDGVAAMDIDEDDDDVPELVDRSTIADGGATLNADDVLGFIEHFNKDDNVSAQKGEKQPEKTTRNQPAAATAKVKTNVKQSKENVAERKVEEPLKEKEREKTLEERLTDTLLASKEILASTTAKASHPAPAAVIPIASSATPLRKKRKLNLADLIDHPSQLLELMNRPPTQDSFEVPQDEPEKSIEIKKRQPEQQEEDDMDALLAMEPPAAATAKRTRSSRTNSNVSVISAQADTAVKAPAANIVPPASKPRSDKPLSIDSDEDGAIDAALDDLLAPVLVAEAPKPFKPKQESADNLNPVPPADQAEASDPETGVLPPEADAASGSAAVNDAEEQEDDDDDAPDVAPLEWRKTKTPLQRELARVSKAKPRAVIRRVNAKPAASPAAKKKRDRVKVESEAEEDDFMADVPPATATTPSSKHPMARFEAASAHLLPLFPDLSLHSAANLLELFDDNVEKSVNHVLAHPDEFKSTSVASPTPQRRTSVRVSHRSPSQSQESQQHESKYNDEHDVEQRSKAKRPSRGASMKQEVSATQADFDAQLDELLASAETPAASSAAATSRSRTTPATVVRDEDDASNDEHMDALLAQINQHDAPAASSGARRSTRASAASSTPTSARASRTRPSTSAEAAASLRNRDASAAASAADASIAENYYNSSDFLERSRARIQRADLAEEKRQIRNSAAQYEADFQAKMDEDSGPAVDAAMEQGLSHHSSAVASAAPVGPYDFQASQEEQKAPRMIKADVDANFTDCNNAANANSLEASLPAAPIPMWSKKKGRVEGPTVVSVPKLIQVRQARGELHQVQMKKREIEARRTGGISFGVVGARNTRQQRQLLDDSASMHAPAESTLSRRSSARKRTFEEASEPVKQEDESHYEPAARNVLTRNDSLSALEHVAPLAPAAPATDLDAEMQFGRRQDVEVRSKRRK